MSLRESDANAFLAACPGAGKTHEVITRFLYRTTEEGRRGIALLSFSNCAVDEAKARCSGQLEALRSPNFVGTFDGFIHRFITTPHLNAKGMLPRYVDEWGQLPDTTIRLGGSDSRLGFELEWFDFEPDGTCEIDVERPHSGMLPAHRALADRKADALCRRASSRWMGLIRNGIISCSAARIITTKLLSTDNTKQVVSQRLAARFAEIIVDEMQDCSADELEILRLCQEAGIDVMLVADLDQSIYEFRNAAPGAVRTFADTLTPLPGLMENRRSTPEISSINNSLRFNHHVETARRASLGLPVFVIVDEEPRQVRSAFLQLLTRNSIHRDDAIVLAHRHVDAERIAGNGGSTSSTRDRVASLAVAVGKASDPLALPRDRQRAQTKIRSSLLAFLGLYDPSTSVEQTLFQAGLGERWFARLTASVKSSVLPHLASGRSIFTQELKRVLSAIDWPEGHTVQLSTIRTPASRSWAAVAAMPDSDEDAIRASTVHGVKGREFGGVLLAMAHSLRSDGDNLTVLDHWEQDRASEARRVLYVGASRASDLLALAVPSSHHKQVTRILSQDAVAYREIVAND